MLEIMQAIISMAEEIFLRKTVHFINLLSSEYRIIFTIYRQFFSKLNLQNSRF